MNNNLIIIDKKKQEQISKQNIEEKIREIKRQVSQFVSGNSTKGNNGIRIKFS
jgi:hypothetical protein